MPSFTGLKSNFFTGVVEDRNDPLYLGRVRVRIYGLHTDDKKEIASPDLPWSDVLMPTTSPSLSGLGLSPHGLVEGSTVMGFFRDEDDMQNFVVIGSLFGRPSDNWKIINNDPSKTEKRDQKHGFNDPRLDSVSDYDNTNDKPKTGRNFTLMGSLENSPRGRPKLEVSGDPEVDGKGTKIEAQDKGINYPRELYTKDAKSDINESAITGSSATYPNDVIKLHKGQSVEEPSREGMASLYPFNHMIESESGHVIEMDDTPEHERLHMYHRSGTRFEILPKGDAVLKVANDSYEITLSDKKILVGGNATIEVANGNYNINVKKGKDDEKGELFINTDGPANITAGGAINMTSDIGISINGTKFKNE